MTRPYHNIVWKPHLKIKRKRNGISPPTEQETIEMEKAYEEQAIVQAKNPEGKPCL